jgi:TolB-like protein
MRRKVIIGPAAAAVLLLCALPCCRAAGADPAGSLARDLAAFAASAGLRTIVVARFSAGQGVGVDEALLAGDTLALRLAEHAGLAVIERQYVERALRQAGSGETDRALKALRPVQGVVSGQVTEKDGRRSFTARLLDSGTGRLLYAAEAFERRGADARPARDGIYSLDAELPGILVPEGALRTLRAGRDAGDLRDSVADYADGNTGLTGCAAARQELAALNAGMAAAKAAYWAGRLRTPAGGPASGESPGSEIADPAVRARFFRLLQSYYNNGPPELSSSKLLKLEELLEKEERFFSTCGGR